MFTKAADDIVRNFYEKESTSKQKEDFEALIMYTNKSFEDYSNKYGMTFKYFLQVPVTCGYYSEIRFFRVYKSSYSATAERITDCGCGYGVNCGSNRTEKVENNDDNDDSDSDFDFYE